MFFSPAFQAIFPTLWPNSASIEEAKMRQWTRFRARSRGAAALSVAVLLGIVGSRTGTQASGQQASPLSKSAEPAGSFVSGVVSDHTLKSLTEVVNVPVTVRDEDQRLISDLKREDFSLAEDGRAQLIKYFSRTRDVPLTLGLMVDTTVCQDEGLPLEKELA